MSRKSRILENITRNGRRFVHINTGGLADEVSMSFAHMYRKEIKIRGRWKTPLDAMWETLHSKPWRGGTLGVGPTGAIVYTRGTASIRIADSVGPALLERWRKTYGGGAP